MKQQNKQITFSCSMECCTNIWDCGWKRKDKEDRYRKGQQKKFIECAAKKSMTSLSTLRQPSTEEHWTKH